MKKTKVEKKLEELEVIKELLKAHADFRITKESMGVHGECIHIVMIDSNRGRVMLNFYIQLRDNPLSLRRARAIIDLLRTCVATALQ